jgi:hypothetical protein
MVLYIEHITVVQTHYSTVMYIAHITVQLAARKTITENTLQYKIE